MSDDIDGTLPDDVLLELGRLTWAAIKLEDVVYEVCKAVQPRGSVVYDDTPIGTRIDQALSDLGSRPEDDLRRATHAWLTAAKTSLVERNSVLHSVPVTFEPLSPDITPGNQDPMLAHFPKKRHLPAIHTSLTVEGLRPIRAHLENARLGWIDLARALWSNRPSKNP